MRWQVRSIIIRNKDNLDFSLCACMQVDVHVCTCGYVSVSTCFHVHSEPAYMCMCMYVCDKGDYAALPSNRQNLARTAFCTKMGMQVELHMTAKKIRVQC